MDSERHRGPCQKDAGKPPIQIGSHRQSAFRLVCGQNLSQCGSFRMLCGHCSCATAGFLRFFQRAKAAMATMATFTNLIGLGCGCQNYTGRRGGLSRGNKQAWYVRGFNSNRHVEHSRGLCSGSCKIAKVCASGHK